LYTKSNPTTYLKVNYQYPNGLNYIVYKNNVPIQEVYINDYLGNNIERYNIQDGLVIRGNGIEIHFTIVRDEEQFVEFHVFRELIANNISRDCFSLGTDTNWYGGPEQINQQYWPIESCNYDDYYYLPKRPDFAAISERYWLNSNGLYAYVSFETPLFITQKPNETLCLIAEKKKLPYNLADNRFVLDYFYRYWIKSKK